MDINRFKNLKLVLRIIGWFEVMGKLICKKHAHRKKKKSSQVTHSTCQELFRVKFNGLQEFLVIFNNPVNWKSKYQYRYNTE